MTEPARPPPPKSYVPITILELEDAVVPDLPPRPPQVPGTDDGGAPLQSPTQDPSDPSAPSPIMSSNEVPTPSNQPPTKPERHRHKNAPPMPPMPYNMTKKSSSTSDSQQEAENRISFEFDEDTTVFQDSLSSGRRHTVGSKKDVGETRMSRQQSTEISRPKFSPPDMMTESLYTAVNKKNKRYPAPEVPAPPPPYEGKASPKKIPPPDMKDANKPERSVSPPGYEMVASGNSAATSEARLPLGGRPRPPPSRPSRPPAANPPPSKDSQGLRGRSATVSSALAGSRPKSKSKT